MADSELITYLTRAGLSPTDAQAMLVRWETDGPGGGEGGDTSNLVTLDTDQEIAGEKNFTEVVTVGDPDGIRTEVQSDSVQIWGNLSSATQLSGGSMSLTPLDSSAGVTARYSLINFGANYWDGGTQGVSPGLLKYQPNAGSPYFEFNQPVQISGLTVPDDLLVLDGSDLQSNGQISVVRNNQEPDNFVSEEPWVRVQNDKVELSSAEDITGADLWGIGPTLSFRSTRWTGSAPEADLATVQLVRNSDANNDMNLVVAGAPLYASNGIYASNYAFPVHSDAYISYNDMVLGEGSQYVRLGFQSLNFVDLTYAAYVTLGPGSLSLGAYDASASPFPVVPAQVLLRSKYWDGAASVAVDGSIVFQPNDGSPYFEFDQPVRIDSSLTVDNEGKQSTLSADTLSLVSALADVDFPYYKVSHINLYPSYWNGSTATPAEANILATSQPDGTATIYLNAGQVVVQAPLGVTAVEGAELQTRVVGGTASGAPVSGTFQARDVITTTDGHIWVCTAGGTPGTWRDLG